MWTLRRLPAIAAVLIVVTAAVGHAQEVDDKLADAARRGDLERVEQLLANGSRPNAVGAAQKPAVMEALENGHREVVRLLIERGGPSVITFAGNLLEAILDRDDEELAGVWWQQVAAIMQNPSNAGYASALLASDASRGHLRAVEFLLAKGVPGDAPDPIGETPLMEAIRGKQLDVAKLLIARGANVDRDSASGGSVLTRAVLEGPAILDAVLAARPDVNRVTKDGHTALTLAAQFSLDAAVERLLRVAGIDTNIADVDGKTPLMWAVENGRAATVAALLRAGADPSRRDKAGETAAGIATSEGLESIAGLLREAVIAPKGASPVAQ